MEKIKTPLYQPEDERKIDYKSDEFRKKNKINKTYFKNNIKKYKDHFDINVEEIKNFDEDANYNIPFLVEPIMGMMFKNFKLNPLVDGRRNKNTVPIDKLIEYNKRIFEDIENLPNDMKYNIKNTSTYEFNYILNEVIPIILDKMSILFSLIISESNVSAGNSYIDLIDSLDSWIINFANTAITLEEKQESIDNNEVIKINIDNYCNFNFEKNNTYIMDKILKDEYIKNINKVDLLKEKMKLVGTEDLFEYIDCKLSKKKIDKSKIDRDKLIKWINDEEYLEIYNYEQLLEDREKYLLDFKKQIEINRFDYNKEKYIKEYTKLICSVVYNLNSNHKSYIDKINVIDTVLCSDKYDRETKVLYKKAKEIINSREYTLAIEQKCGDIDIVKNEFDELLYKSANDIWMEYNAEYNDIEEKIKDVIDKKYKEFDDKQSQLNLIRTYLSKAMGQTITPTLQKEIMELSKKTDEE